MYRTYPNHLPPPVNRLRLKIICVTSPFEVAPNSTPLSFYYSHYSVVSSAKYGYRRQLTFWSPMKVKGRADCLSRSEWFTSSRMFDKLPWFFFVRSGIVSGLSYSRTQNSDAAGAWTWGSESRVQRVKPCYYVSHVSAYIKEIMISPLFSKFM